MIAQSSSVAPIIPLRTVPGGRPVLTVLSGGAAATPAGWRARWASSRVVTVVGAAVITAAFAGFGYVLRGGLL